jgi:hypothetical protein
MYILNHNPKKLDTAKIMLEPNGKFWQLYGVKTGLIAESDSWRRLVLHADKIKMELGRRVYD